MTRQFATLSSATILLLAFRVIADQPRPATDVTIAAVPDSTSLYAGDPLLIKSVLRNDGKQAVALQGPFDSETSGVRIEVCPPESEAFGRVLAVSEGRFCGIKRRWEFEGGKTIVCYSELFGKGTFSTPGKWRIRVVTAVDGKDVISEPVTLSVVDRPERARRAVRDYGEELSACVRWHEPPEGKSQRALEACELLGPSRAGTAIRQALLLRDLAQAGPARARTLAMIALKKYRADLGPVAREYLDLLTADVLMTRKEFDDAKVILDGVTERSHVRDGMRDTIRPRNQKQ